MIFSRTLPLSCLLGVGLLLGVAPQVSADAIKVDLEDLTLGPGSFYNGSDGAGGFVSRGAAFNNEYSAAFGSWSGWAYSNIRDVTTAGFGNQYAAYHVPDGGGGDKSANYAVAYAFHPGDAYLVLPEGATPLSARITNTTYAALSMLQGDAFAKRFGGANGTDPDFFLLTIYGYDVKGKLTGTVDLYLADYRSDDSAFDYVIDRWTTIDLTPLGAAVVLAFELTSSDVGPFGINTPTYFALDNLEYLPAEGPAPQTQPMPEPAALGLAGVGAAILLAARARRRMARADSPSS